MVMFKVMKTDGLPLSSQQVIVRTTGRYEYGITDHQGYVSLPIDRAAEGKIIIGGKTVYLGDFELTILIINLN